MAQSLASGRVIVAMSISVDGYIAGRNDGSSNPLGEGGEALFSWYFAGNHPLPENSFFRPSGEVNARVLSEAFASTGCVLNGRRTFDIARGWGGTHPLNGVPVVILTHRPPEDPPVGKSKFHFVATGIEDAVAIAKAAAAGKDVGISGASVAQQALDAGLVDEVHLTVAPVLLGKGLRPFGTRLQDVRLMETLQGDGVTHLRYAL